MISARYAPALCLLLAGALVPTVIHSYVGATTNDGREVRAIPLALDGTSGRPTSRNPGWGQIHFESGDWFERSYQVGASEVVLTVVRSYDLKRLYHHPELDIAYGTTFITHDVKRVGDRAVPVNVMWTVDGQTVAVSVLRYDDEFVEHPYRLQMRTAMELMVSARKPMTLFFAVQRGVSPGSDVASLPVTRLLLAAVDQLLAQRGASR
jgi:hypothetical protein